MDPFTRADLNVLLEERQGPCVSIYVPTRPGGGEGNSTRYRQCLGNIEAELARRGIRVADAREFLRPATQLLTDSAFWKATSEGVAVFLSVDLFRKYRLPVGFEERIAVGRNFLVTPLLPLALDQGRFFVLALSQNGVRLLQATREGAHAIQVRGMPAGIEEALAAHDVDSVLNYHTRPGGQKGNWAPIFHGHGVGIDDHKDDLLLYFRRIDHALRPVLAREQAPLVVAGVDYLLPIFRQACTYPHIVPEGVPGNPDKVSDRDLHQRALPVVEPYLAQEQSREVALYERLSGTGRTVCGADATKAAIRGEVEILLVARDRPIWGRVDDGWGKTVIHKKSQPGDEDLVNVAVIDTLRHRGAVHVLPAERLPADSVLAGICWRPHSQRKKG